MTIRIPCLLLLMLLPSPGPAQAAALTTANFEYVAEGNVPGAEVMRLAATLERRYRELLDVYQVTTLPRLRLRVFARQAPFRDNLDRRRAAARFYEPFVYSIDEDDATSINIVAGEDAHRHAVHGLVHLLMLNLNPQAENNPRWLWESLALFDADQFVPPRQLSCISLSSAPSLARLNQPGTDSTTIYRVGYLIGDYLVSELGRDAALALVRSGGNVEASLGMRSDAFERGWHDFTVDRYLDAAIPPILSRAQLSSEIAGHTFYLEDGRHLYFARDRTIYLTMGSRVQSGRWHPSGAADVCWQVLNFPEICAQFRRANTQFFLDVPPDCTRHALRRVAGDAEGHAVR